MNQMDTPQGSGDPRSFGDFELQALLGEGTFAKVYQATRVSSFGAKKEVALKVLDRRLQNSSDAVSKDFLNEARLGGSIRHPNLVETYECGRLGDRLYIAMALVDGPNLGQVIEKLGQRVERETVVAIAIQAARGLRAIHRAKIDGRSIHAIHRDMKPANILLTTNGEVKLTDYGISRFNADFYETMGVDQVRGSPQYMSPEQAGGEKLTQATDVFSFGLTFGRLISGRHLFPALTVPELMLQIRTLQFSDALDEATERVPELKEILLRCLEAKPEHRYADGGELFEAILDVPQPKFGDELIGKLAQQTLDRMPPPLELVPGDNFGDFWSPLSVDIDDDRESVEMDSIVDQDAESQYDAYEELQEQAEFPRIERPADQSPRDAGYAGTQADGGLGRYIAWLIAVGAVFLLLLIGLLVLSRPPESDPGDAASTPAAPVTPASLEADGVPIPTGPDAPPRITATIEIQHEPIEKAVRGRPIQITATLKPVGIHQASVWYRADPGGEWANVEETTDADGMLSVTLPASDWLTYKHTSVSYFIDASSVTGMVRSGTSQQPHTIAL